MSTHNPKDPEMFRVILDNIPILKFDTMRNILSKYAILRSKRQSYSLMRLLTKAKFTSNSSAKATKCYRPNCGLCIYLLGRHSCTFKCGANYNKKQKNKKKQHENMSCDVNSVMYVMKCRGCGEEYTGETGNLLRQRVTIYSQQIRDPRTRMLKVS